jgi:hypothetical protein
VRVLNDGKLSNPWSFDPRGTRMLVEADGLVSTWKDYRHAGGHVRGHGSLRLVAHTGTGLTLHNVRWPTNELSNLARVVDARSDVRIGDNSVGP